MTTPSSPTAIELRKELEALWAELEPWLRASDEWTHAKEEQAQQVLPSTPTGALTVKEMDAIEEWRHQFRRELDSVQHVVDTIPARSNDELQGAIAAARELTRIPRAGFRGGGQA